MLLYFLVLIWLLMTIVDIYNLKNRPNELCKVDNKKILNILVLIPARGKDLSIKMNFKKAIKYIGKRNLLVLVDSKKDYAYKLAKDLGMRILLVKGRCSKCSGKTRAIIYALKKYNNYDAYIILDSDVSITKNWLNSLISNLNCRGYGASTTFPIFKPIKNNFWSYAKEVWGLVGISLVENEKTRFGWGGSLAFKREIIDKKLFYYLSKSKYALSDDISITKRVKDKNMKIAYSKDIAYVYTKENFSSFFEWSNRQTFFTLLGSNKMFYFGIAYYSAEIILILLGGIFIIYNPIFIFFYSHLIKSIIVGYKRIKKINFKIIVAFIIMPFIYLINLIIAKNKKEIFWRGRKYVVE